MSAKIALNIFPSELLQAIFSFLPPETIVKVMQVCKRFKEIGEENSTWRQVLSHYISSECPPGEQPRKRCRMYKEGSFSFDATTKTACTVFLNRHETTYRNCLGITDIITRVACSPNGNRGLVGCDDGKLYYFDLKSGTLLNTLSRHKHRIKCLSYSPDGNYALSGSRNEGISYWDLVHSTCLRILQTDQDKPTAVAFSPNGNYALSGYCSKVPSHNFYYWDLKTGSCLKIMDGSIADSITFSPDGKRAFSTSSISMTLWDMEKTVSLKHFDCHELHVLRFYSDCRFALTGFFNGDIRKFDIENGTFTLLGKHDKSGGDIVVFSNGKSALTCSWTEFYLWNLEEETISYQLKLNGVATLWSFSSNGTCALVKEHTCSPVNRDKNIGATLRLYEFPSFS